MVAITRRPAPLIPKVPFFARGLRIADNSVIARFDLSGWSSAAGQPLLAGLFKGERGFRFFFDLLSNFSTVSWAQVAVKRP